MAVAGADLLSRVCSFFACYDVVVLLLLLVVVLLLVQMLLLVRRGSPTRVDARVAGI